MGDSNFQDRPPRPKRNPPKEKPRRRPRYEDEDYDDEGGGDESLATLIPYKNGMALAAYYCGVFGLIPCVGLALGPAALILGIIGLRYVRKNPRAKGTGHAITGVVLGTIELLANWGVLLIALIGYLSSRR